MWQSISDGELEDVHVCAIDLILGHEMSHSTFFKAFTFKAVWIGWRSQVLVVLNLFF